MNCYQLTFQFEGFDVLSSIASTEQIPVGTACVQVYVYKTARVHVYAYETARVHVYVYKTCLCRNCVWQLVQ